MLPSASGNATLATPSPFLRLFILLITAKTIAFTVALIATIAFIGLYATGVNNAVVLSIIASIFSVYSGADSCSLCCAHCAIGIVEFDDRSTDVCQCLSEER